LTANKVVLAVFISEPESWFSFQFGLVLKFVQCTFCPIFVSYIFLSTLFGRCIFRLTALFLPRWLSILDLTQPPDLYSGMSNPSCSLIDAQSSVQTDIPQQFSRRRNEWRTLQGHLSLSAQDPPFIHNRSLPLACSNYRECRKIYQVKNYASDLFYLFFGMKRSAFPKVEPVLMGLLLGMPEAFEERSLLRLIIVSIFNNNIYSIILCNCWGSSTCQQQMVHLAGWPLRLPNIWISCDWIWHWEILHGG